MDGAFVDESGCIQCVIDVGGRWCVYGITRTDDSHYFWVGDIHGTPAGAKLVLKRVTDTAPNHEVDGKQEGDAAVEPEGTKDAKDATVEPEGASKLSVVGNDIVWSDGSKWTKVMFSPAQVRLIMRAPPNSLSLIGLCLFVFKKIYSAMTGRL